MADPLLRAQIQDAAGQPADFSEMVGNVGRKYPALAPHLSNFAVQWGKDPGDGRQLEFYPPWESANPNPGKTTIELYRRDMSSPDIESAIAGDGLHLLGSVNPQTGKPVDPSYFDMKQKLIQSLTPQQQAIDQKAYQQEAPMYGGNLPPFQDWMNTNRGDAYIRGYLTPDATDEWRKNGVYTPDQKQILDQMGTYLSAAPPSTTSE